MYSDLLLPMLVGFGMCVMVPLGLIAACVYVATRYARDRHEERMKLIAQGMTPPAAEPLMSGPARPSRPDPAPWIAWAVGLLVAGLLWFFLHAHFASLLIGAGAAFLTRGVIGLRRRPAAGDDFDLPQGDPR